MIAIAVDDEHPMLQALAEAVGASPDIRQLYTFGSCSSALEWLEHNAADVAFLDISMRGIGGLALAERINQLQPACKIVFCTGYEQYALDAIQLRCSGYLIKPITAQAVQKELDHIKKQSPRSSPRRQRSSALHLTFRISSVSPIKIADTLMGICYFW